MSIVNISQGGNKLIQVLGLKDIQARMRVISDAMVRDEAAAVVGNAAVATRDAIYSYAEAAGIPKDALEDVYVYTRQPGGAGKRDSIAALAGLKKMGNPLAQGYTTWYAGKQTGQFEKTSRSRKRRGILVVPGKGTKIGENKATMFEFGTTKMQAKPFFRPAISAIRGTVLQIIADGYKAILEAHAA